MKHDLSTGIITINSDPALSTILDSYFAKEKELDEDFVSVSYSQLKILFQIKIEKYRSISDIRDLTSEQVNKIATAQAIEAAILEYNCQFNLTMQTQMGYHELIYTAIVTAISTALSIAFTAGMGTLVNSYVGKEAIKQVSNNVLKKFFETVSGAAISFSLGSVIGSVVNEIGQELLLDPWIESTVSGLVRRAGGDAIMQMVRLRTLRLANNKITEIKGLDRLVNLVDLDLGGNEITEIKGLDNLVNLRILGLGHNRITDVRPLVKLTSLETIFLIENPITDIEPLKKLPSLKSLYVNYTQIPEQSLLEFKKVRERAWKQGNAPYFNLISK